MLPLYKLPVRTGAWQAALPGSGRRGSAGLSAVSFALLITRPASATRPACVHSASTGRKGDADPRAHVAECRCAGRPAAAARALFTHAGPALSAASDQIT